MARTLVVKVTAGAEGPRTLRPGVHAGVSLWLTGESARFALPGRAAPFELPHSAPLSELLDPVLAGGRVTLCSQRAARREIGPDDVLPGVRIAGAAVFVEEAMADAAQALVY